MTYWKWHIPSSFTSSDRADKLIVAELQKESEFRTITRSQLHRFIEEGLLTVNGMKFKTSQKLKPGDDVKLHLPAPKPLGLQPDPEGLEILYEDKYFAIVNKPQGLSVHPSDTEKNPTLVHRLLYHMKDLSGIGGILRPGIVHRIDKNTSGSLLITKSDEAHQVMTDLFARHEIDRRYWALCYGTPRWTQYRMESLIGRNPSDRKKMSMKVRYGRKASSRFTLLKQFKHKKLFACLIEACLETGRTHQVRVHLTGLGHGILGDITYGPRSKKHAQWLAIPDEIKVIIEKLPGQALHARHLGFRHPFSGQMIGVDAEPPGIFWELLQALERYETK